VICQVVGVCRLREEVVPEEYMPTGGDALS
jgi:hypothetical protein